MPPPFESCTQLHCHLRDDGVDSHSLAGSIVRALSGEEVVITSPIYPFERCVECAGRVMRGGKPLPTVEEVDRSIEAGKLAYRRSRRKMKRWARGT